MLYSWLTQPVARGQHIARDTHFVRSDTLIEKTSFETHFLGRAEERLMNFENPSAVYLWRHALH
jgi:hypothetical protein